MIREREKRGWHQLKLSRESGVTQPTLSRIERGGKPSFDNAVRIAAALEWEGDMSALFEEIDEDGRA